MLDASIIRRLFVVETYDNIKNSKQGKSKYSEDKSSDLSRDNSLSTMNNPTNNDLTQNSLGLRQTILCKI